MEIKQHWRIGFITNGDPKDRRVWSGITSFIFEALQQEFDEVIPLGPFQPVVAWQQRANSFGKRIAGKIDVLTRKLSKGRHVYEFGLYHSWISSQFFKRQLAGHANFDFLVVPASHFSVALLWTKTPIVLVSDATFSLLNGYYPDLSDLSALSQQEFFITEKLALNRAWFTIYSSEWAAHSALTTYGISPDKLKVLPFGANIDPESEPTRQSVLRLRQQFTYKLLFMGVDWERKGGAIALECVTALKSMGIDVHLTVCGCEPPEPVDAAVTVIKYLDKNHPRDYVRFLELLQEADFLLLPTRADCTPISFCEAAAYGLPVITTDTGGIAGVVDEGETGFLLPLEARGSEYAHLIAALYANKLRYDDLVIHARDKYEKELNWRAWATSLKNIAIGMQAVSV